jgi:hypothetical protein
MLSSCYVVNTPYSIPDIPEASIVDNESTILFSPSEDNSYRNRNRISQPDVGSIRSFWSKNHTSNTYYQVGAELLAIGNYCYIYMEDVAIDFLGDAVALERSESYRDEFDTTIYPYVVDLAGNPDGNIGDIDEDPRIIILLSTNPVCYYDYANEIEGPVSNLCEMIYITYTTSYILGVISHEFHHLVLYNHDNNEAPFLFESLAQFAAKYTGSIVPWDNITWGVDDFVLHPEDSLIYWTSSTTGEEAQIDYGSAYLFGLYLAEQFGIEFMRNLVTEEQDGAEGIIATLDDMGYNITFNQLYLDWITTLAIDEPSLAEGQYGFHDANARMHKMDIVTEIPRGPDSLSIRAYGFNIHRLVAPPDYFVIELTYPSLSSVGLSIAYYDSEGWHVQQRVESGGLLIEEVQGSSISDVYIMTTYLFSETPSGSIQLGLGPSIDIRLSILEEVPIYPSSYLVPIGLGAGILAVAIIIIIWHVKRRRLG